MHDFLEINSSMKGDSLLWITLNSKGNIITTKMMLEILEAISNQEKNDNLKLIVIQGSKQNFSYGASIEEHKKENAVAMLKTLHKLALKIACSEVPVAALVEGKCLGGAFELVLCCHFVFATEDSSMGCPEIKLGVFPPILAAIGPEILGLSLTEKMVLTGKSITPGLGKETSFLTEVFVKNKKIENEFENWFKINIEPVSAFSLKQACVATRRSSGFLDRFKTSLLIAEKQYIGQLINSFDGNEGINAFTEKRTPKWQNK